MYLFEETDEGGAGRLSRSEEWNYEQAAFFALFWVIFMIANNMGYIISKNDCTDEQQAAIRSLKKYCDK